MEEVAWESGEQDTYDGLSGRQRSLSHVFSCISHLIPIVIYSCDVEKQARHPKHHN
jgi:hypothetical protein